MRSPSEAADDAALHEHRLAASGGHSLCENRLALGISSALLDGSGHRPAKHPSFSLGLSVFCFGFWILAVELTKAATRVGIGTAEVCSVGRFSAGSPSG